MKKILQTSVACGLVAAGVLSATTSLAECQACNDGGICTCVQKCTCSPFLGRWALDLGGGAGWLGVEKGENGTLKSSILWYGGSVVPTAETKLDGDKLIVIRKHGHKKDGKDVTNTETLTFTLNGRDLVSATSVTVDETGKQIGKKEFKGNRIPPIPQKPDLSKLKFGDPIPLVTGNDLTGWKLMNDKAHNGWTMKDGVLSNNVFDKDGKRIHGCANIMTEQKFEDFKLHVEVKVEPGCNSGIYLRGIYEIQVLDSYGKPVNSHHMGALYSRITPSVAAEKPAGEWQTEDITLVNRHLTVVLNGKKIIDNQPILGCTGGAITANEFVPGPIYLQGDHSNASFRNMVLTPIVK